MTPQNLRFSLPRVPFFQNDDEYVASLMSFATSCELFQRLCGGVHILDFLTKEPDLYSTVLPQDWRDWFQLQDISDILDLLMREDSSVLEALRSTDGKVSRGETLWRDSQAPPVSLLEYILTIRRHSLGRDFVPSCHVKDSKKATLQRHVAVGMKPKKIHEVQNFVKYIDDLSEHIASSSPHDISHIIDFGSGQNYLGRALASAPYIRRVVALESKQLNIDGARSMDVHAKLVEKEKIMRNKKQYRSEMNSNTPLMDHPLLSTPATTISPSIPSSQTFHKSHPVLVKHQDERITYVEMLIQNGDLSQVIERIPKPSSPSGSSEPQLMVTSLHSCGNLLHHGVRSLMLNASVKAVAVVGCCYNLVTERLGPPTYKLPSLRSSNLRLDTTS